MDRPNDPRTPRDSLPRQSPNVLVQLAARALRQTPCGDRAVAAFVIGSSADLGYVPRGGDLDVQIVVEGDCAGCFEELLIDDIPIEIFCVSTAQLRDVDALLSHRSLPIDLVRGVVVSDTSGIFSHIRRVVSERLGERNFVHARFRSSVEAARGELGRARKQYVTNEPRKAAFHLTVAFWHVAAAVAGLAGQPPTTRRCGVVLATTLMGRGRPDLATLSGGFLNPKRLPAVDLARLARDLAAGDRRVTDAVEAMLASGEIHGVGFPLLRSALWSPMAERHRPEVGAGVCNTLGWNRVSLAHRVNEAETLLTGVEGMSVDSR